MSLEKVTVTLVDSDEKTVVHKFKITYEQIADIRVVKYKDTWYIASDVYDWSFVAVKQDEILSL